MLKSHELKMLPLANKRELTTLVENRRAYTLSNYELNIFETYEESSLVPLQFDDLVIINMIKGKKIMHLQEKVSFDYFPGETLLLPEYTQMKIDFPEARLEAPTQCTAITIDAAKIREVLNYLNEFYPKKDSAANWSFQLDKFHFANNEELSRLTNRLFQVSLSSDLCKDAIAELVLKELMIRIMQMQGLLLLDDNTTSKGNSVFEGVKQYIKDNLSEKLSVEKIAGKVGMSKSVLARSFKNEFGISPMEFVIRARLQHAKKLLRQVDSVKEACFSSGFSDLNYFIRLFKQREGLTPGQYMGRS